jgi:hypothetical protein
MKNYLFAFISCLFGVFIFVNCTNKKQVSVPKENVNKQQEVKTEELEELKIVLKYYSKRDVGLGDEMCDSRVIICVNQDNCTGFATDCSNEYGLFSYFNGKKTNKGIKGNYLYFDNCGGSGEGPEMCMNESKFDLVFSSDSTRLTLNKVSYSESNFNFKLSSFNSSLYESPSITSKLVCKNPSGLQLKEIGGIEKQGGFWYLWLKVMTKNGEGWVLGNINVN